MTQKTYQVVNHLYGINGDSWSTPESTEESFWAALGAGASGLIIYSHLSADNVLVCTPADKLPSDIDDEYIDVKDLTADEIQTRDAGSLFRSRVLDEELQPTEETGDDLPWKTKEADPPLKKRRNIYHPTLARMLQMFGRRTDIVLRLPEPDYPYQKELIDAVAAILQSTGLKRRIPVVGTKEQIQMLDKGYLTILDASNEVLTHEVVLATSETGAKTLLITLDQVLALDASEWIKIRDDIEKLGAVWHFILPDMPFAPTQKAISQLAELDCNISGLWSHGVLSAAQALAPHSVVLAEDFTSDTLDPLQWRAGYSHKNTETQLTVDNGLHITIREGCEYSGAAAINIVPIHGDFDATVKFKVENPHQATTFELAAIGIDPGYNSYENNTILTSKTVNLTFDVHGSPPYASSERDQNDAFRCGWNNSFNATRIHGDWQADSFNSYNKYGRGVGDGSADNPEGYLRLVRTGSIFNSYYRDKHNREWVGSGSMLVQNMPEDCFLRLALKHWTKKLPAPQNQVRFSGFRIYQY